MKRFLLSQGRTGSLNLTRYIRESNLDIRVYREPFNTTAVKDTNISYSLQEILTNKNIFVENKIGEGSLPNEFKSLTTDDLVLNLKSKFEKIGILCRKDLQAQTESVLNAKYSNLWHTQYVYKEVDIDLFPEFKFLLENEKEKLKYISTKYSIPIFYYEDLYGTNQINELKKFCKYFSIEFNQFYIDKHMNIKNKYRVDTTKKII